MDDGAPVGQTRFARPEPALRLLVARAEAERTRLGDLRAPG